MALASCNTTTFAQVHCCANQVWSEGSECRFRITFRRTFHTRTALSSTLASCDKNFNFKEQESNYHVRPGSRWMPLVFTFAVASRVASLLRRDATMHQKRERERVCDFVRAMGLRLQETWRTWLIHSERTCFEEQYPFRNSFPKPVTNLIRCSWQREQECSMVISLLWTDECRSIFFSPCCCSFKWSVSLWTARLGRFHGNEHGENPNPNTQTLRVPQFRCSDWPITAQNDQSRVRLTREPNTK